jgi:hypothetical protein
LKLLSILAALLLILIPSSGATETEPFDPINRIVNWFPVTPTYRCSIGDPKMYVAGLEWFYGQNELFVSETVLELYDNNNRQFTALEGTMVFLVNQETGTFTIAVILDNGMFCEVSHGWNFTPYTR